MQETLNDLYTRYAASLLTRQDLEAAIYAKVWNDIDFIKMPTWNKEEKEDFVSSLYQRIGRAIDLYQNTGSSFETYIGAVIRMMAKHFHARQFRGYIEESAAWITQIPEMYACESEAWYDEHFTNNDFCAETAKTETEKIRNPRQLLILILKCCNHVSADFLEKVSSRLGIEDKILNDMIYQLRERQKINDADHAIMRERVNRQFYRCILFEKKLQNMAEGSEAALRIQKQLEKEQIRLKKSRNRLLRLRLDPSNRQIAELLGISKGTVDSVLYALRKRHPESQNNPE